MPPGAAPASRLRASWPGAAASCALLALLAGCAGPGGHPGGGFAARHYRYPPPGPPGDPWGPYIREAAQRFGVPEQWVRAVMRQESGGRDDAISSAGAMGLMQVMPGTYAILRARYNLGDDPYEPHDNIMAGTAYIRELYDQYGAPGFLAAYNAGPQRLDVYLANGTPLPDETVGYLSSVAPRLGSGTALSGPLAMFAANEGGAAAPVYEAPAAPVRVAAVASGACDPNAAFDPDHPCAATAPQTATVATAQLEAPSPPYQPAAEPAVSAAVQLAAPAPYQTATATAPYAPASRAVLPPLVYGSAPAATPAVQLASLGTAHRGGGWAIQVGAFTSPGTARAAAELARRSAPDLLAAGEIEAPATTPFGGAVLYRARVAALSAPAAAAACARLSESGNPCMAVPPGR